ncbi:MAG: hypothetical protein ACK4WM_00550 [Thermoflexales bacterium]
MWLHVRRAFHNQLEQHYWAAEWVWRVSSDGVHWQEIEQALIAEAPAGCICKLRIHGDHST